MSRENVKGQGLQWVAGRGPQATNRRKRWGYEATDEQAPSSSLTHLEPGAQLRQNWLNQHVGA